MEYLEGHSLRRELELKGGRLTPSQYWPILAQVTEGLSFAHSMNVVHRDVKPDNIFLLTDGRVKLTDFGIARAVDYEQTHLTKTGVMMGTLAYVSPEQLQDAKNVDNRADIFSLGVVTYESIFGHFAIHRRWYRPNNCKNCLARREATAYSVATESICIPPRSSPKR